MLRLLCTLALLAALATPALGYPIEATIYKYMKAETFCSGTTTKHGLAG
jgi:hypothetical protein